MEKDDIISFLDQYDEGFYDGQVERHPFTEWDEEPPSWIQERIPQWDRERLQPRRGVEYTDYDIDAVFDRENQHEDRPNIADLDENRELSDEEVELLIEEYDYTVSETGFEAYAWYLPFHYTHQYWGIYIKEEAVKLLANLFYAWSRGRAISRRRITGSARNTNPNQRFDGDPISSRRDAAKLALEILLRHEWMHHQVELLATYLEGVCDTLLYEQYHEDAYRATFPGSDCIEESVANAYVARSTAARNCALPAPFKELFELSTRKQPEAYREYKRFTGDMFKTGCRHLAHLIRNPDAKDISSQIGNSDRQIALGDQLLFARNISKAAERGQIPIYILKSESERDEVYWFKAISLDQYYTDYDIIRTESFEKAYNNADGSIRDRVDTHLKKLRESIHHGGFEWRPCKDDLSYLKINDQYRMIAQRDDQLKEIELIDFSTNHDLPKKYGCYK